MLEGVMFLASYYSGGEIGNMISQWQQAGFFSYVLPWLLLFALIFGLLTKMNLFQNNKGINAIIAIVVAFMALQFEMVPRFFAEIFPRLGVGLALILVAIILLGIFIPNERWTTYLFFVIGAVIFLTIFFTTSNALGWGTGQQIISFLENIPATVWAGIFVVIVVLVTVGVKPKEKPHNPSVFIRDLHGH
jgi:hypothetical protein